MELSGTQGASDEQDQTEEVTAAEYIKAARLHLRSNRRKESYSILLKADAVYPNHPIILSYLGWLQAVVDKKNKSGLAACRKAFLLFKTSDPHIAGSVYPILFLNLGLTFLSLDRKEDAVESFLKGLQYDRSNRDLKKELQLLGIRKKPSLTFLSRSNPLNMIIGKLRRADPKKRHATR